jgi:hypothetical protein
VSKQSGTKLNFQNEVKSFVKLRRKKVSKHLVAIKRRKEVPEKFIRERKKIKF